MRISEEIDCDREREVGWVPWEPHYILTVRAFCYVFEGVATSHLVIGPTS